MSKQMKRLFIGFGIMFGMQFLAAYVGLRVGGKNPDTTFFIMLGFALAAYFGGGLVMGLLSERVLLLEPAVVSMLSVLLNAFISSLSQSPQGDLRVADVLFTYSAIQTHAIGNFLLAIGAVIVAALVGALIGERITIPTSDWITSAATIGGLASLVLGPLFLLARVGTEQGLPSLPTSFLIIIVLMFLVVVAIGYILFTREPHDTEEFSINPERRRDLS